MDRSGARLLAIFLFIVSLYLITNWEKIAFSPTSSSLDGISAAEASTQTIAEGLSVPWEVAFLPDGRLIVTERRGLLKILDNTGNVTIINVEGVEPAGEGGLLGLALHPRFEENRWLYVYLTSESDGPLENRVERYRLSGKVLEEKKIIIDDIPASPVHNGGRMAFGPDGSLYVTTGDASHSAFAQDKESLAGKILRVREDGSVLEGNPFGNLVWSYGHRNPQGLAWDSEGNLWATEHGRSGAKSGLDELNIIVKGGNYGWPEIEGNGKREGMTTPSMNSGEQDTWAPAGAAYLNGSLFFAGLRGQSLYEVKVENGAVSELKAHFRNEYGRLRSIIAKDGSLYVGTSNMDGRGQPKEGDDRIIRIDGNVFSR